MAVIVKRLISPTASSASSTAKYITDFDIVDWVAAGANYTITITAGTHGVGSSPTVRTYLDTTTEFEEVEVDVVVETTGDVVISVTSTPDNRFKGKLIII
jgi:hypothetical protein